MRARIRHPARAAILALGLFPGLANAYDVAVVQSFENPVYARAIEGFQETCGGTVVVYTLNSQKKLESDDFDEIKNLRPAAVLAVGQSALTEILERKPPMPVIFTAVTEKPADQFPDAGVLMNVPMGDQIDALLKIAPDVKNIGVVYNPAKTQWFVDDLVAAAKNRKVAVILKSATTQQEAIKELQLLFPTIGAYLFAPDTSIHGDILEKSAATLSLKHRIPLVGFRGGQCSNGFLFASEMDPREMGREAGEVTRKLLNGNRPSPAYSPLKSFTLVLNSKVAKQLGLTVPVEVASGAKLCRD